MADAEEAALPPHLVRLNPEQYRAVTTIEGPVLVLAGAGSGKTRVLTRRIAHLLHCGVEPKNILAVTFTNKAAAEMRERVAELIGDAAERVWVSTFHASCARILRTDIEALGWTRRFAIYDDDDQVRMIKGLLAEGSTTTDQITPGKVRAAIDSFKNLMLTPDKAVRERRSHLNDTVLRVWRDYEEALKAADALDFNDLVGKTVELFDTHPDVLQKWRERFRYVLVDEYQDTNRAQYLLLSMLAAEHRNLAVVGDDDQSIYGFRGADVSNILNFQQDYPEATVVRLEQNYRSTGHILTLANAVVAHNPDRLDKRLWTSSDDGVKVQLMRLPSIHDEAARVAAGVAELQRRGQALSEIAVIYRTNAIARYFEAAFRQLGIPHRVVGGRKFYERREVRDLLAFLRVIVNPVDDAAVLRIVNVPPRGIGAKTQAKLREEAARRGLPLLATARAIGGGASRGEKGIGAFAALIDQLITLARDLELPELVAETIERTGYRAMLEAEVDSNGQILHEAKGRLANLQVLVEDATAWVREQSSHLGPLEHLTSWLDRIALTADTDDLPESGEVTLMTVHSSKGLEFPVVFVVQMNEGVFPHERSLDSGVEEERRLAYVAFTRAMKRLVVTRSLKHPAQGARAGRLTEPSRFLFGIPMDVVDGDVPLGEPASARGPGSTRERVERSRETTSQLGVFLERRQRALPEDTYTLVEIESAEQLQPGVRVFHPNFGVGEISQVAASGIYVLFEGRQQRIAPPAPGLRIVVE